MKKVLSVFMCIGLMIGLVGCGSSESKGSAKKEYVSEKDIKKVYSDPEKYEGKYIKVSGQVFLEPETDDDAIYFQMFADPENSNLNTLVSYNKTEFEINDGDYVEIDGRITGGFDGENAFGGSVSAVKVIANKVKKSSYINVVSPTIKEVVTDGLVNSQNGVDISISKVEFAKKETRVYYKVTNNSGSNYSFYDFNMKAVQNGKQIETESNYKANYPSVSGDILNGITSEGIASFPSLEQANFEIHFDRGYSDNYDLDFNDFTLSIVVNK